MVTCKAVGYPDPFIDWMDSSGNVISANIRSYHFWGTYESTFSITLLISQNDCQGTYSCTASNSQDLVSRIIITRSIDVCTEGEFRIILL